GQVACDAAPGSTFVGAHPELAAGGAEVKPERIARIGRHRLTLDGPPRLLGWQAAVEALPARAGVARAINRGPAAGTGAWPHVAAIHREDPRTVGVARMDDERKTDAADLVRHVAADAHPGVARTLEAIHATVVLLIEAVGRARAEAHAMRIVEGGVGDVEAI